MKTKYSSILKELDEIDFEQNRNKIIAQIPDEAKKRVEDIISKAGKKEKLNKKTATKFVNSQDFREFKKYVKGYCDDCFLETADISNIKSLNYVLNELINNKDFIYLLSFLTKNSNIIKELNKICRELEKNIDPDIVKKLKSILAPLYKNSKFYNTIKSNA